MDTRILRSTEDRSVNFVTPTADGAFEARYVRRTDDYFITYLSSHSGCDKACRFCHLTQTGQTSMTPATLHDYAAQAHAVLTHYDAVTGGPNPLERRAPRVNFNFMARGEPLSNPHVVAQPGWDGMAPRRRWRDLAAVLGDMALEHGVPDWRFNLSTIMPADYGRAPLDVHINDPRVTLYYSLYSMRPEFRRRWLPKAMDPREALYLLAQWRGRTGGEVALHWSLIEGQNDDDASVDEIIAAVDRSGLRARFNLVRYNPYSAAQGREPRQEVLERVLERLSSALGAPASRIVPRVGFDVKASCGMFVDSHAA